MTSDRAAAGGRPMTPTEALAAALHAATCDRRWNHRVGTEGWDCSAGDGVLVALAAAGFAIVPAEREDEAVALLRERIAAVEHEQWRAWAGTLISTEPGISTERRARWETLIAANYEALSEEQKDQDRAWADRVLALARLPDVPAEREGEAVGLLERWLFSHKLGGKVQHKTADDTERFLARLPEEERS